MDNTPTLLEKIRFQITCEKRQTPVGMDDVSLEDIYLDNAMQECWHIMKNRFDKNEPILEEPNTLGKLRVFLWHKGIRNVNGFIEKCLGRTLQSFGRNTNSELSNLSWDLENFYYEALNQKRPGWREIGKIINREEVIPDPNASHCKEILDHVGETPRFEHYRWGYFKERHHFFNSLWESFKQFILNLEKDYKDDMFNINIRKKVKNLGSNFAYLAVCPYRKNN